MSPERDLWDNLQIPPDEFPDPDVDVPASASGGEPQWAVLAGGCFWCVEAVYKPIDGVLEVRSGYTGGSADTADYESVCSGRTDHAEAVHIRFDPQRISYGQLLKVFFTVAHDPTQRNRQGADVGRQYRSAIFYADDQQRDVAQRYLEQLERARVFRAPIVTEIVPLETFYQAEQYHHDYAAQHPYQPYIVYTALPKVKKLREYFAERLKGETRDE